MYIVLIKFVKLKPYVDTATKQGKPEALFTVPCQPCNV